MNIIEAVASDKLFAPWFKSGTWDAWFAFLAALFALPMTPDQFAIFNACTGRAEPPATPLNEAWLVCGRRAGKSFIIALIAVFLACFVDYRRYLAPGERGTILVIAADRKQARVILRYIRGLLKNVPLLAPMLETERAESIDLTNHISIEIATASYRTTRGYTLVAALLDEVAFWTSDDTSEPDAEVLEAIRPGMATIPNAMLLCASSPYGRRGVLHDAYQRHYGVEADPVLVWRAATRTMNATVPQRLVDEAMERNPAAAASEWLAEFRADLESFVTPEVVRACVVDGVYERQPETRFSYHCFVDPAGGSGGDSMTMCISHVENGEPVIDAIREARPPFSPATVCSDFAAVMNSYRISRCYGDRFAGSWPAERLRECGITYEPIGQTKSQLYQDLLPSLNSGKIELLDHKRTIDQLILLERRTSRTARDIIDHRVGGRDDCANSLAGAAYLASKSPDYGQAAIVARAFVHELAPLWQ